MATPNSSFERAASFFRNLSRNKNEEKIPFANDSTKKSSGAILQALPVSGNSQTAKETVPKSLNNSSTILEKRSLFVEEDKGPMTKSRKACFLLSFNVWIIYIATFLWFIPCDFINCPGTQKWNVRFSNMDLTTQLKTVGGEIIFGYKNVSDVDFDQGELLALNSTDGNIIWTKSLHFVPLQVYCGENASGSSTICTAIGETKLTSFNSSNGHQVWEQVFASDSVEREHLNVLICGISQAPIAINRNFQIDDKSNQYKILNFDVSKKIVGLKFIDFPTSCDELFFKIGSINNIDTNKTDMVFICAHSYTIDLWIISSKILCGQSDEVNATDSENIYQLYRIISPVPMPAEDVLIADTKGYGFVVGWLNAVILLSKVEGHPKTWEHSFEKSSVIISLIPGHFTSAAEDQIAATTENENGDIVVSILNLADGSMMSLMSIGNHRIKSVSLVPGKKGSKLDLLLVEVGENKFNMSSTSSKIWGMPETMATDNFNENSVFHVINFRKQTFITTLSLNATSVKDKIIVKENEDIDLVLAEAKSDFEVTISDYILKSSLENGCS